MPLTITPPPVQPSPVSVPLTLGSTLIATSVSSPPAVQPAAITISDAAMIAALQADGYTVTNSTATGTTGTNTSTPVIAPPVLTWDGSIVRNGVLSPWFGGAGTVPNALPQAPGGNWDSACTQTQENGYLLLTPTGSYMEWLPHPPGFAGAPSQNGIAIALVNSTTGQPFTEFVLEINPAAEIGQLSMFMCGVAGGGSYVGPNPAVAVTDQALGAPVTIGTNIPPGVPTMLTVKLSALAFPNTAVPAGPLTPAPYDIYKIAVQVNNPANGTPIEIINAYFQ